MTLTSYLSQKPFKTAPHSVCPDRLGRENKIAITYLAVIGRLKLVAKAKSIQFSLRAHRAPLGGVTLAQA